MTWLVLFLSIIQNEKNIQLQRVRTRRSTLNSSPNNMSRQKKIIIGYLQYVTK